MFFLKCKRALQDLMINTGYANVATIPWHSNLNWHHKGRLPLVLVTSAFLFLILVASKQMSCVWLPHYMSGGSIPEDLLGWLCWSIISFFRGTCSSIFVPFLPCELTKLQSKMRTWQPCGKQMRPNWCAREAKCCTIRFTSEPANDACSCRNQKIQEVSLETRRLSKHVIFRRLGLSNHVKS